MKSCVNVQREKLRECAAFDTYIIIEIAIDYLCLLFSERSVCVQTLEVAVQLYPNNYTE